MAGKHKCMFYYAIVATALLYSFAVFADPSPHLHRDCSKIHCCPQRHSSCPCCGAFYSDCQPMVPTATAPCARCLLSLCCALRSPRSLLVLFCLGASGGLALGGAVPAGPPLYCRLYCLVPNAGAQHYGVRWEGSWDGQVGEAG